MRDNMTWTEIDLSRDLQNGYYSKHFLSSKRSYILILKKCLALSESRLLFQSRQIIKDKIESYKV
jgi:hypothetical protein